MTEAFIRQPEPIQTLGTSRFNGMNAADEADELVFRSHKQEAGRWRQIRGAESPDLKNMAFFGNGIGKRLGSTETEDLTAKMVASEELIGGKEWRDPATDTRILFVVGKKSLYVKQGGAWSQLTTNDSASTAYTHADGDVTKFSIKALDGHLFFGHNKGRIQVYRNGTALDDQLSNESAATTVDASSASGQKVLRVTATTMFNVHDRISIDAGAEFRYIASIQAGVSVTLTVNLGATYTNEVVTTANVYEDAFDSTISNTINGDWPNATFILANVHDRLVYTDGAGLLEYTPSALTPSSGIWDVGTNTSDSGSYVTGGRIVGIESFIREGGDENTQLVYLFTSEGSEILTGFAPASGDSQLNRRGGAVPINNRMIAASKNWLIMLTEEKRIIAVNGATEIDLGRRMLARDGDGPLDDLNLAQTALTGFSYFSDDIAYFYYNTGVTKFNDSYIAIDFQQGEPQLNEPLESYEQRVRVLYSTISAPNTNDWFSGSFRILGGQLGITKAGKLWTIGGSTSPLNDLDTIAIEASWKSPLYTFGDTTIQKNHMGLRIRSKPVGDWLMNVDIFLDRNPPLAKETNFTQLGRGTSIYGQAIYGTSTYGRGGQARGFDPINRFSEVIQYRFYNSNVDETFELVSFQMSYQFGAEFNEEYQGG